MDIAVIEYPCSGGAKEVAAALKRYFDIDARQHWYENEDLGKPDLVILPGGYSFGDFLRPGALAKVAPISGIVANYAKRGGKIVGFGNGFQILCELGLLPGALLQNPNLKFVARDVYLKVESDGSPFLSSLKSVICLPVACYYGRYYAGKRAYNELEADGRIVFRYATKFGDVDLKDPFLGSMGAIAGLRTSNSKIFGTMVRPERVLKTEDGKKVLEGLLS